MEGVGGGDVGEKEKGEERERTIVKRRFYVCDKRLCELVKTDVLINLCDFY